MSAPRFLTDEDVFADVAAAIFEDGQLASSSARMCAVGHFGTFAVNRTATTISCGDSRTIDPRRARHGSARFLRSATRVSPSEKDTVQKCDPLVIQLVVT
jgi:hypothetical protein